MNRKATPYPTTSSSTLTLQRIKNENSRMKRKKNTEKKTLSTTLLSCLIGKQIQVEIKNGCKIKGILDEVDSSMNLTIGNTTTTFPDHLKLETKHAELIFIQGTRIRYISFEENVNSVLKHSWESKEKQKERYKRQWIVNDHLHSKKTKQEEEETR